MNCEDEDGIRALVARLDDLVDRAVPVIDALEAAVHRAREREQQGEHDHAAATDQEER